MAALGLVAVLSVAGCTASDDEGGSGPDGSVPSGGPTAPIITEPPPTERPTDTTTDDGAGDEAQIRQLIADWYEVRVRAAKENQYDPGEIAELVTGDARSAFEAAIAKRVADGQIVVASNARPSTSSVSTVSIDGERAVAAECEVDAHVLIDVETREVLNDSIEVVERQVHLRREGLGWRIERVETAPTPPEDQQCDS